MNLITKDDETGNVSKSKLILDECPKIVHSFEALKDLKNLDKVIFCDDDDLKNRAIYIFKEGR